MKGLISFWFFRSVRSSHSFANLLSSSSNSWVVMKPTRNNLWKHFCHVFLIFICRFSFLYHNSRLRDGRKRKKKNVKQKKEICMLKRGYNFKSQKLFSVLCFAFQFALYFKCKFVCVNSQHLFSFIPHLSLSLVLSVLSINLKARQQARETKINDWVRVIIYKLFNILSSFRCCWKSQL